MAPAILDDHKLKDPINREAQNQPLLEMYKKINISLMSIGAIAGAVGLCLTYDHRAIDGAPASRFLCDLCFALENFSALLAK